MDILTRLAPRSANRCVRIENSLPTSHPASMIRSVPLLFALTLGFPILPAARADNTAGTNPDAAPATPAMPRIQLDASVAPTSPADELVQSVVATDIQRTAALVAGDTRQLERLLADELTYGHSDGRLFTKTEFLAAVTSGLTHYHAINPGPRAIRIVGDNVAVICGQADLLIGPADAPTAFAVRYLAVYRLDPHTGWKLTAYQSTKIADAK